MTIVITKYIEEPTNGKRLNAITGKWERRSGMRHEERPDHKGRMKMMPVTIWEETDPPRKLVYGSEEHEAAGFTGGTVTTEIVGCEDVRVETIFSDEVEYLLRRYATQYADAMFILRGGAFVGGSQEKISPLEAVRLRDEAVRRAARFGVDLEATNVDTAAVWQAREARVAARALAADQNPEDGVPGT
jgi:hypothetical protein